MDNIGQHIIEEQNKEPHIFELAAQKKIYSIGKGWFYTQVALAVPVPIILSIAQSILGKTGEEFAWVFALYGILAAFSEIILDTKISKLKELAAKIQEKFDCAVLNIQWNNILTNNRPDAELIYLYYSSYIESESLDQLYNWYSLKIETIKTNIATIICQRTNCTYDFSIRKKFRIIVIITAIITFIVLFIVFTYRDFSLKQFLLTVLTPSIPVFILAFKQIKVNNESITILEQLKNAIEAILLTAKLTDQIDQQKIRQIQDLIFCNRKNSPLMPDKLYERLWGELEASMNFSVETILEELTRNQ